MDTIRLQAMAKINLGLDVTGVRDDGYHEVRMIMQMIRLFDRISIEQTAMPGVTVETNLHFLPCDERNITYRAAKLLLDRFQPDGGVSIRIEKHIPVAAGMAGGSTDCAAVLYGINKLYSLGMSRKELMETGLKLGADVPFCLLRRTALSEGVGEVLTPVPPLPPCKILIAKPPISVSTKRVYQALRLGPDTVHPDIDGMIGALGTGSLKGVADRLGNVLESVTIPEHPVINKIKGIMNECGAMGSLMSGSGPTVFGIYDQEENARRAYAALQDSGLVQQVFITTPVYFRH